MGKGLPEYENTPAFLAALERADAATRHEQAAYKRWQRGRAHEGAELTAAYQAWQAAEHERVRVNQILSHAAQTRRVAW